MRESHAWALASLALAIAAVLVFFTAPPRSPRADMVGTWYGESVQFGQNVAYLNRKSADGQLSVDFRIHKHCELLEGHNESGTWAASWLFYRTNRFLQDGEPMEPPADYTYVLLWVGRKVMYYFDPGSGLLFSARRVSEDFTFPGCYGPLGTPGAREHAP